jgi:4a-hydroxytetrahydrobiopterin dehydratase
MAKLSADRIGEKLTTLGGWRHKDNAISKQFRFKDFMDGIRFINRVAELAEAADHHPDIQVNYTRITFFCSTHSEGGVTDKDFDLAAKIEDAYRSRAH